MNFMRPSKIQEKALPLLLADPPNNMIAQSQSGTGKTAAFVLAILSRVNYNIFTPQALILAPTRELARQIMGVIQSMGRYTGARSQFAIPKMVVRDKISTAHIVVGTPGTVLDCIRKKWLPVDKIRVFVIDEADTMLDQQGLGEQCVRVKLWVSPLKLLLTCPTTNRVLETSATSHRLPKSFSGVPPSLLLLLNMRRNSRQMPLRSRYSTTSSRSSVLSKCTWTAAVKRTSSASSLICTPYSPSALLLSSSGSAFLLSPPS